MEEEWPSSHNSLYIATKLGRARNRWEEIKNIEKQPREY